MGVGNIAFVGLVGLAVWDVYTGAIHVYVYDAGFSVWLTSVGRM